MSINYRKSLALLCASASLGFVLGRPVDALAQGKLFGDQKLGKLNDHTALVQGDGPQAPHFSSLGVRLNGVTTNADHQTHVFNSFCGATPDFKFDPRMGETSYTFDERFGFVNFTGLPGALVMQTYKPGEATGYVYVRSPAAKDGEWIDNAYVCQHATALSAKGLEADIAAPLTGCVLQSAAKTRAASPVIDALFRLYDETVGQVCPAYLNQSATAKTHAYVGPGGQEARDNMMRTIQLMRAAGLLHIPAVETK